MRQEGPRLVLATSSGKDELENLLDVASLGDLIDDRVTKDDVAGHSKPDPDIVEAAVRRSRLSPVDLVMLGDTPFDIEAAGKVRVKTIAVRCGGWSDASLAGAAAIYDGPADLLSHYDDSPLGRDLGRRPTRPDPLSPGEHA